MEHLYKRYEMAIKKSRSSKKLLLVLLLLALISVNSTGGYELVVKFVNKGKPDPSHFIIWFPVGYLAYSCLTWFHSIRRIQIREQWAKLPFDEATTQFGIEYINIVKDDVIGLFENSGTFLIKWVRIFVDLLIVIAPIVTYSFFIHDVFTKDALRKAKALLLSDGLEIHLPLLIISLILGLYVWFKDFHSMRSIEAMREREIF